MKIFGAWLRKDCGALLLAATILGGVEGTQAQEESVNVDPELIGDTNSISASAASTTEEPAPAILPPAVATNQPTSNRIEATNAPPPPPEPSVSAEQAWKSFMQLQGQMDTALLAIERSRREREIEEEQNQRQLEQRLKMIEQSIDDQRAQEAKAMREANHNMLLVAGIFAGVGFLAMVLTSIFHFRAMNKLGGIIASFPLDPALGFGGTAAIAAPTDRLLSGDTGRGEKGNRLLGAIERLEQRIHELEHTSQPPLVPDPNGASNGNGQSAKSHSHLDSKPESAGNDLDAKISMVLGKGQALLNMGQATEAIACFDEALAVQPKNAEAWIKKGAAMEKLSRLPEAIECYDQAISANEGMTLAYLYKGGVFNRLERYNEALACYEKALQTQKGATAVPTAQGAD